MIESRSATKEQLLMPWIAQFPGEPGSAGAARRMVRDALGCDPRTEEAELIASELVTNALLHSASGQGGIVWVMVAYKSEAIRIEVTDEGKHGEPLSGRNPEEAEDFGRGLAIVDALAQAWGAHGEIDECHTVWAELGPVGAKHVRCQEQDQSIRAHGV
ncbi:hypothetical protein ABIA33_007642 [Streptacidiphilus sp. MAP12-16]|uniref:ATP-binding protein n=1 Tax=Streptacidiphilus sp. MAP12-16 TaxID=3156300 RepID=UPI00351517E1